MTARPWVEGPNLTNNYLGHKKAMAGFTEEEIFGLRL